MILKENVNLKNYTSIKIGGIAKNFYTPETREELLQLSLKLDDYKILGGGSNLLINDKKSYENIIYLKSFDKKIINDDGIIYVGASVRNQQLINVINKLGYGGIEYLYSVPGFVGGAIVMNAGRGKKHNQSISDYVIKVDVLVNGTVKTFIKEQCNFEYRNSIFKKIDCIVLGAYFKFNEMNKEESAKLKKERLELCRRVQDVSKPNFGTFFCMSNYRIMQFLSKLSIGDKRGCHLSKKTINWVVNGGTGNYEQVALLINITKKLHAIFHKECILEIEVWE